MPPYKTQINAFFFFFLGALSCQLLSQKLDIHPVIASSLVGLLGSFLKNKERGALIYSGSFAGMSAGAHFFQFGLFVSSALMGLIGGALFLGLKKHFNGFGGKLGTIAFMTVLIFLSKGLFRV